MKKPQSQELLAKIGKMIKLQDMLSLKTDLQVLLTKKMSLGSIQELLTKIVQNNNKLTLIIIFISIILCLDIAFILRFQVRALGTIKPKIVRLKSGMKNLNKDLIMMQRHQQGLRVSEPKKIVPADQMPWVIEEISHLANQQEVRISQINPYRQLSQEEDSRRLKSKEEYSLIHIDLEVSAGYHQLGRFLADLENHSTFLEIAELDMKHSRQDPFVHKVKLKLNTYVANE